MAVGCPSAKFQIDQPVKVVEGGFATNRGVIVGPSSDNRIEPLYEHGLCSMLMGLDNRSYLVHMRGNGLRAWFDDGRVTKRFPTTSMCRSCLSRRILPYRETEKVETDVAF